ncbi:MAG TPA: hypothetical protein VML55_18185 [Planctomycetaceae bacterium]|nr:hypothetical protein [Planctomycetaceae bacterium]
MDDTLRTWFDSDESPSDFYQLLGKPRLHPSRDELLEAVRAAYRAVHTFENHAPAAKLPRARDLQRLIMEAEQVIGSDDTWRAYDESLAGRLREQYVAGAGGNAAAWRLENLRLWLTRSQNVHPARVEELIQSFVANGSPNDAERTLGSGVLETVKSHPSASASAAPAGPDAAAIQRAAARMPAQPARTAPRKSGGFSTQRPAPAQRSDAALPAAPPTPLAPPSPPSPPASLPLPTPASGTRPAPARSAPAVSRPVPAAAPSATRNNLERSAQAAPGLPRGSDPAAAARALNNLLWMLASAAATAVVFGLIGIVIVLSRNFR